MNIQELHTQAMELADKADVLKQKLMTEDANSLYAQSLKAEKEAAYAARKEHLGEPTESVLFRSAASLAYCLKDYREAERLICMGLAGEPPAEIADELRSLYNTVALDRSMSDLTTNDSNKEREKVTIAIPVKERKLLDVLVKKFGWACVF